VRIPLASTALLVLLLLLAGCGAAAQRSASGPAATTSTTGTPPHTTALALALPPPASGGGPSTAGAGADELTVERSVRSRIERLVPVLPHGATLFLIATGATDTNALEPVRPTILTALGRDLRAFYRRPTLRMIDTQGRGVSCGKGALGDWAGHAVPYPDAMVVELPRHRAWLADSEGTCIRYAYDGG
jgi:hypothetical protein